MNNNKTQFEPRSPISGSAILANCGLFKRENKPNWATARNVPWQVTAARAQAAAKEKKNEIKESFRHTPRQNPFSLSPVGKKEIHSRQSDSLIFSLRLRRSKPSPVLSGAKRCGWAESLPLSNNHKQG